MKEPEWIYRDTVLGLHELSIEQHGGSHGIRDEGLLDSALGRPQHLFVYGNPNLFDLAACYAYGLVKNHPFINGNKRTGFELQAADDDATTRTLALAAGEMTEAAYAAWLEANSKPVEL